MVSSSGRRSLRGAVGLARGAALLGRGVDHREVELLVAGAELDQQVEDLVQHRGRALLGPVDLVHHQDRAQAVLERLAQHEARLRHHAFHRVHQQQHGVHHAEHALHLAAEVGVAGRVDQMDVHALEADRGVLGVDRDAALALLRIAVHHALDGGRLGRQRAGLAQQAIQQRRLAVIDVRDDREVADVLAGRLHGARRLAEAERSACGG